MNDHAQEYFGVLQLFISALDIVFLDLMDGLH
jgi:hypothetical protein